MRPNQKFLSEVREKISGMTDDNALSYLRGCTNPGFNKVKCNTATTKALAVMRRDHTPEQPEEHVPELLKLEPVTVDNENESFKKVAKKKIRRKAY